MSNHLDNFSLASGSSTTADNLQLKIRGEENASDEAVFVVFLSFIFSLGAMFLSY